VNVGASNASASWIDWTDWNAWSASCAAQYDSSRSSGRTNAASNCAGSFSNTGTANNPVYTWTADHSKWNGCVTDRDQNYDTTNTAPGASKGFPAEQYSSCPTAMMGQSYDWTALNAKVDAMVADGSTNQTIGLVWGWQSLTQGDPLNAPAQDPNYKYQNIIILLTDGLNTQDRWYGDGSNPSSQVDNRMRLTCTNIKNAKITLYAVQVN